METKKEIRKRALAERARLKKEERERACVLVTERILGHQWFYGAESILGFAGFGSEIDTSELLKEALRTGKRLYLPRVEGEIMNFYRVRSLGDLISGYKGILEPLPGTEAYEYSHENAQRTLMLMPGAAFDGMRGRLGYGKGFYDKYLADKPALQLRTIAIGFRCQMVEEIPMEERHIRPCQVICC